MSRRAVGLWTCVCAVAWMAGCSVDSVMEPNVEAQFAQGGVKGKPSDSGTAPPVLWEYWVYADGSGQQWVHMVVKGGDAEAIKKGVAYDHFFNGYRDRNPPVEQHTEYRYSGAQTPPATKPADGLLHTDLPFSGEQKVVGDKTYFFPKYYATNVDGSGADPFAFSVGAYNKDGNRLATWDPLGVIVAENTLGSVETVLITGAGHDAPPGLVRSYATWNGGLDPLPLGDIWVATLDLEESSLTCSTTSDRKGKKKSTSGGNAVITGTVTVTFGRDPQLYVFPDDTEFEYLWWEGHFYDVWTGALSEKIAWGANSGTWSLSLEMPAGWTGGEIAFVVDYLYPKAPSSDPSLDPDGLFETFAKYAYNPERNGQNQSFNVLIPILTTAGHSKVSWYNGIETKVDDEYNQYPLAQSPSFGVECN